MQKFLISFSLFVATLIGQDYVAKDYNYLINKMPEIHPELLQVHFKLYGGYVDQVNRLNLLLEEEKKGSIETSFTFQAIKRRYGWEYDGMVLHELYFDNLGGNEKLDQGSFLYQKIVQKFGSYDNWIRDFKATALTRGVGWVVLSWDSKRDLLFNAWITEHDTGPLYKYTPLLVIDLWEHAYLSQFQLDRGKYLDIVFKYIDWTEVSKRL